MPVHWYYDTQALDRDYGQLDDYMPPKNPHPDSILWRSSYTPRNEKGDILHDQAQFWGQRGIHYHQFLPAGENTINFLLAVELYRYTVQAGRYQAESWLDQYIEFMLSPGRHQDTYLEEYHRAFFDRYASGKAPGDCGIDDLHIGGLATVPALIAALDALGENRVETVEGVVREHVALTHRNAEVDRCARAMVRLTGALGNGQDLQSAILEHTSGWIGKAELTRLAKRPDREIIGRRFSPACYLPESFTASICLAWKHSADFSQGILANARCGGDSCHRGAVVGSLLGAANDIPDRWLKNLQSRDRLRVDNPG